MTYETKIITGFGTGPFVGRDLSYLGVVQNDEDRGWLTHTHVVLEKLDLVLSDLLGRRDWHE
jgi:hypothetical protein